VKSDACDGLRCHAYAGTRDRFFWERVETGESYCAWGSVDEIESGGNDRFRVVRSWAADLLERLDWIGAARPESSAILFGGFGFDEDAQDSEEWKAFPPTRFVLPEVILENRGQLATWVFIVRIEPGATAEGVEDDLKERWRDVIAAIACEDASGDADSFSTEVLAATPGAWSPGPEYVVRADRRHAVFRDQVLSAIREIRAGRLSKVVLARSLRVDHDDVLDLTAFLSRLRSLYPTCTLIAVGRGSDTFVSATPETLVRVEGRRVETAALAGSAPRGRHPKEDRSLAQALLSSEKEREEHDYVVEAIRSVLDTRCDELEIPGTPRLRPLLGIQHLETPVAGRLSEATDGGVDIDVLGLVQALHPTPAVGGVPAEAARSWIRRFEGLDRGWYAAPVGWLDSVGGGDFRVALRSALIRSGLRPAGESGATRARLFAGAGIVAGSEPERELTETRIKLRALLAPLTEI